MKHQDPFASFAEWIIDKTWSRPTIIGVLILAYIVAAVRWNNNEVEKIHDCMSMLYENLDRLKFSKNSSQKNANADK